MTRQPLTLCSGSWASNRTPFDSYSVSRLDPKFLQYIHAANAQTLYDEAGRLFERAIAEFADLKSPRQGRSLDEIARSGLDEALNNLLKQLEASRSHP
jgi:hypothetical protein